MATLSIGFDLAVTLGGELKRMRSTVTPTDITITQLYDPIFTIAAAATVIAWDPTLANVPVSVTGFSFMALLSDTDGVDVELQTKKGDANTKLYGVRLQAGVPLMLASDASYYNYTTSVFAGTLDHLNRIRMMNNNASAETATVRMWLAQ